MTDAVTNDCPVGNSSSSAQEQFATAKVADHLKENTARRESSRVALRAHYKRNARGDPYSPPVGAETTVSVSDIYH